MTIHNLSTGLILYTVSNGSSPTYRPVVTQWNDTILILDECQRTEYSLTGIYKSSSTYFSRFQSGIRNYIHHDYAGRRYICNYNGANTGIYAFLNNGTQLAIGPKACSRAFQLYMTKEQAMLSNTFASFGTMQIIDF